MTGWLDGWDGGCEDGAADCGTGHRNCPFKQAHGQAAELELVVLEANETEWAEHVPASASSSSAAVCCPTGNGSREERRGKKGCRRSRMLIGSAAGDWRPWPKTCVALRHCRAERKLTASFSQGGGGGKIGDEKAALLRWCCAPEAPMEPRSTITTLAQARPPTTMQRRTRTPTTHALGHHQGSSCTTPPDLPSLIYVPLPTARCPRPAGPILGYSESVSPWNVYLNHRPLPKARVPPPVDLHSLPFRYSRLRAAHTLTHSLTRPSQQTDHFILDDLSLLCWSTSSSLLAPTRPDPVPRLDQTHPRPLISGLRYGGLVPHPTKADLGNLATSPWYKQADPGGPFFHAPPSEVIIHSFRPSTSTWTTSCPIHQTAAPATALFFMR